MSHFFVRAIFLQTGVKIMRTFQIFVSNSNDKLSGFFSKAEEKSQTVPVTILEHRNQEISTFHFDQERRATDFEALKLVKEPVGWQTL